MDDVTTKPDYAKDQKNLLLVQSSSSTRPTWLMAHGRVWCSSRHWEQSCCIPVGFLSLLLLRKKPGYKHKSCGGNNYATWQLRGLITCHLIHNCRDFRWVMTSLKIWHKNIQVQSEMQTQKNLLLQFCRWTQLGLVPPNTALRWGMNSFPIKGCKHVK